MPTAMEILPKSWKSFENLEHSLKFSKILRNSSIFLENLENCPGISRICSEISPAGLEISQPVRNPPNPKIPKFRFPARGKLKKIFSVGCMISKSLIPDVFEFLPDLKSPQPNGYFECRGSPDSSDWLIGSHIGRASNPRVSEPYGKQWKSMEINKYQ